MNHQRLNITALLLTAATIAGCQHTVPQLNTTQTPATAAPTVTASVVDAPLSLDDPRWQDIPRHTMTLDAGKIAAGLTLQEPGRLQLAVDDQAYYLRTDFTDRDVASTATADYDKLFLTGDVTEWFIGTPPSKEGTPGSYFQLHVTPDGLRSAYLITRPGLIEDQHPLPFTAETKIHGTINDITDHDEGWSALFILPRDAITQLTDTPDTAPLTMLVGRYNYGHHLPYNDQGSAGPELSMWPTQPKTAYHLRPHHAPIKPGE